jgi:hypothetical protein
MRMILESGLSQDRPEKSQAPEHTTAPNAERAELIGRIFDRIITLTADDQR